MYLCWITLRAGTTVLLDGVPRKKLSQLSAFNNFIVGCLLAMWTLGQSQAGAE